MTAKSICALAEQRISSALDGELADEHRQEFEEHLETCRACRERYEAAAEEQQRLSSELLAVSGDLDRLLAGRLVEERLLELNRVAPPEVQASRSQLAARLRRLAAVLVIATLAVLGWQVVASRAVPVGTLAWQGSGIELRGSDQQRESLTGPGERTLNLRDSVTLPADGEAWLTLRDGSEIQFQAGSEFQALGSSAHLRIDLAIGACAAVIAAHEAGFAICTPIASARVLGTEFSVEHDAREARTVVAVARGTVEVELLHHDGAPVLLGEGESCRVFRAEIQSGVYKLDPETGEWRWQRRPEPRWLLEKQPLMLPAPEPDEESGGAAPRPDPARARAGGAEPAPEKSRGTPLDLPRRRGG